MKTRLAVFFGGRSTEHEISVISANQAMHAADADRYEVIPVYISKQGRWYTGPELLDVANYRNLDELLKRCTEVYMRPVFGDFKLYKANPGKFRSPVLTEIDVTLPVLHGSNGEDGTFQGVLDTIGLPYAGCSTLAAANGMDKITMKLILQASDIPVVPFVWFTDRQWYDDPDAIVAKIEKELGYPVIVKPANLGSSVGIGRAGDAAQLRERIADAERYSTRIVVEHMVDNIHEINCSVLGNADQYQPSVLEEPVKTGEILSYTDKYMGGSKSSKGMQSAQRRIPAELSDSETERIKFLAGETFRVLSCHGVSRVDMIVDRDNDNIYVNEINTIPGSLSFYLWQHEGVDFSQLIDRLVRLAFERNRQAASKTVSYDQNIFALGGGTKGGLKGGVKK